MRHKIYLIIFIMGMPIRAKDLGVVGTVFEIREQNLLEIIQSKLSTIEVSGKMKSHQQELQLRVQRSIEQPQTVAGIGTAKQYRNRDYNPSFVLDEDIKDHRDNIIGRKGAIYNPLDYHSFGKPLIFINGEDAFQVRWALSEEGKIVLIQGSPIQLTQHHKRAFYFDQGGVLSRKFSISNVPTKISQKEKRLLIEEINPKGVKVGVLE